jgi:hypothetical protein
MPPCAGCAAAGARTSRRNGCRLVFEIDGDQGGAENYEVEVGW